MLRSTFLLLPRVGPVTELALWRSGCRTWTEYRDRRPRVRGVDAALARRHLALLERAEAALAEDPSFFARGVPSSEHWRAFSELGGDAAFLDIETAEGGAKGDDLEGVTVVGVRRGGRTRQFVQGDDLTRDNVEWALDGARMLVTFAGAGFDLPRLAAAGIRIPRVPHLDLHPALRRLGYKGGLKKVEVALGLAREEEVRGLGGYDAVLLWARHARGEKGALERLLSYNRADVDNLEPLARVAYDGLAAAAAQEMRAPVEPLAGEA